jgi:hypothetical protein
VKAIDDEVTSAVSAALEEAESARQTPAGNARVNIYATEELERLG